MCTTELRDDYHYCRDYLLIANFVVMGILPFLLLILFNTLTFRIIRASSVANVRDGSTMALVEFCGNEVSVRGFESMPDETFSIKNCQIQRQPMMPMLGDPRTTKRQKRDQKIAQMFIVIVILFFICNTPRMILNISEVWLK